MRSVRVIEGQNRFISRLVERPALVPRSVRVRIEAAFLPPYFEHLPGGTWMTPPRPFTPGQCAVGIIEDVDDPRSPLRRGQRVYCDMYVEDGAADANHGFIGCFGLADGAARHLARWPNGTFAEEFVGPEHCFTPIPDHIEADPAILCRLGWFATALAGFRRGGLRPGSVVSINGASGLLGASAAVVALAIGASEIRLIGRRPSLLKELQALDKRIVIETPEDRTPLDFVLDCAGGNEVSSTVSLCERLRRYGSHTFVGALTSRAAFDTSVIMRNSNSLIGSFWFPHETAADVLAMIGSGSIDLSAFSATRFIFEEVADAISYSVENSGGLHHVALIP